MCWGCTLHRQMDYFASYPDCRILPFAFSSHNAHLSAVTVAGQPLPTLDCLPSCQPLLTTVDPFVVVGPVLYPNEPSICVYRPGETRTLDFFQLGKGKRWGAQRNDLRRQTGNAF